MSLKLSVMEVYLKVEQVMPDGKQIPLVYLVQFTDSKELGYIDCDKLESFLRENDELSLNSLPKLTMLKVKFDKSISLEAITTISNNPFFTNGYFNYSRAKSYLSYLEFITLWKRKKKEESGCKVSPKIYAKQDVERGRYVKIIDEHIGTYGYVSIDNFIVKSDGLFIPAYFISKNDASQNRLRLNIVKTLPVEVKSFSFEYDPDDYSYKIIRNYGNLEVGRLNISLRVYQDTKKLVSYGKHYLSKHLFEGTDKLFIEPENDSHEAITDSILEHFKCLSWVDRDNKYLQISGEPYYQYCSSLEVV